MKTIRFATTLVAFAFGSLLAFAQTSYEIDFDYLNKVNEATNKLNENAHEKPCAIYDDDEWYTAFNEKTGEEGDAQLANSLLRTCQEQLKEKLAGKVQQITTGYFDQMDIDGSSKAAEHIEGASQMIVDQMINETREYCRKERPAIYEKGKIILYMAIRVKKQELVQNMVKEIKNDAEAKVRFNEQKFRESAFKVFDQDKPQE